MRTRDPHSSLWHTLFQSDEESSKVDRASRLEKWESLQDFCHHSILKRAEEILAARKRSSYRYEAEPLAKVAESPRPIRRVGK